MMFFKILQILPPYFCALKTHRQTSHIHQTMRNDHIEVEKPQLSKTTFQILSYHHFFDQNSRFRPFAPAGPTSSIMPQYYSLELVTIDTKMLYESFCRHTFCASKTHRQTSHLPQTMRNDNIEVEKPQLSKTTFQT